MKKQIVLLVIFLACISPFLPDDGLDSGQISAAGGISAGQAASGYLNSVYKASVRIANSMLADNNSLPVNTAKEKEESKTAGKSAHMPSGYNFADPQYNGTNLSITLARSNGAASCQARHISLSEEIALPRGSPPWGASPGSIMLLIAIMLCTLPRGAIDSYVFSFAKGVNPAWTLQAGFFNCLRRP